MNVTQFSLMTKSILHLLKERGYNHEKSKLKYDLLKESEITQNDKAINLEVKSAKDTLDFLKFLKIDNNVTENELDDIYFKVKKYSNGDIVWLNLEIQP